MKLPSPLARYFIAIVPPPPIFDEAWELKNYFKDKYHSKASLNSPPHITIHVPFLWNKNEETELIRALALFANGNKSIQLVLSGFGAFAPSVIFISVAPNEELDKFQGALEKFCSEELNLVDDSRGEQKFCPHLTLAFRDLEKNQFDLAWREFKDRKFAMSFAFDGFDLLKHDSGAWRSLHHFHF